MAFELREHTADVAVEASGETLEAVFSALADGLAAASSEDRSSAGERFDLSVRAESHEALCFDYLDELIYLRDVRGELPVDNRVERIERLATDEHALETASTDSQLDDSDRVEALEDGHEERDHEEYDSQRWSLEASARGVPLEVIDAREVKAVTYSEMRLERVDDGWEAYVVFDV